MTSLCIRFFEIDAEGNKAGKGGNWRTKASEVHPEQKGFPISCERFKQDCCRDVGEYLTGNGGGGLRMLLQKYRKSFPNPSDLRQIPGEDEKADKGEKECVINVFQCASPEKERVKCDDSKGYCVGNPAENTAKAENKECGINLEFGRLWRESDCAYGSV